MPSAYELARAQFIINKDATTVEKIPFDHYFQGTREHYTTKLPYLRQLYDLYTENLGFRKACNDFLYFHNVKNDEFLTFLHQNLFFDDGTRKPDEIRMNAIIEINGHIRTGKSRLALVVALLICMVAGLNPRIHIDPNDQENVREFIIFPQFTSWEFVIFPKFTGFLDIFFTYGLDQARHVLATMPPGSICLNDETLQLHEEGSQKEVDNLVNAINVASGRRCLNFIFLCPDYVDLPQVDYFLKILAVNYPKRRTLAMLSVHQEKSKVMSHLGVVKFNVTLLQDLLAYYDEFSERIKARTQELAGSAKVKKGDVKACSQILIDAFNDIEDEEDIDWYGSSVPAFLDFADCDASEGWSDKLLKIAARRACYYLGIGPNSREDAPARKHASASTSPALVQGKHRDRGAFIARVRASDGLDAEIMKAELANVGDDTRRKTFLQNGLNVIRQDIDAYFDHRMTFDDLKKKSDQRMDRSRMALREEKIWPIMALLFKTDEEIHQDAEEAERHAWLDKIAAIETKTLAVAVLEQHEMAKSDAKALAAFHDEGFDVEWQEVDAFFRGTMTIEELGEISKQRGEKREIEDKIEAAMAMFQTEREKLLERVESRIRENVSVPEKQATVPEKQAKKAENPRKASPGSRFAFDMDATIAEYRALSGDNRGREMDIFLDLKAFSVEAVAHKYPNIQTGEDLSSVGIKKIEAKVGGWISHKIGHEYEPHLAGDKEKEFAGKARVTHCDIAGQGQPDILVDFSNGDATIYSLKARYSTMSKTMLLDIAEFRAELDTWKRLHDKERPGKVVKLIIVYYDHNLGQRVEKEIENPGNPPEKVRLTRASGEPVIKFVS